MTDVTTLRHAIVEALPEKTSLDGKPLESRHLYVPPAHTKALRLECPLVIGTRGVGKSAWTAALCDQALRSNLTTSIPQLAYTDVRIGFSEEPRIEEYPDPETFKQLLDAGNSAYDIWRSIMARWLAVPGLPLDTWPATVQWVKKNPEPLARWMQQTNQALDQKQRYKLILFDALDRLSHDWKTMDNMVRDLLRAVLWLRPFHRLFAKVFLREDQDNRTITNFPDASKLLATKAELNWARHDLHGLLWQRLINAPEPHGECLREIYKRVVGASPTPLEETWQLPDAVRKETLTQRALFDALAGPWMGRDKRRGVPYLWSVGHLADGKGYTSPRSFLAAIRQAAENSLERYPDYEYALHYESIKRGIQKASEIRVDEMAEDYPWVRYCMQPLAKVVSVPCGYNAILQHWEREFPEGPSAIPNKRLPPQHAAGGWEGIREDLVRLGVFLIKQDSRIDMPDLYRVGFGLGRRGGVKPSK